MITIYEMNDVELTDFLTMYEAGEVLSTEEEITYVMGRLPNFFRGRPKLVNYSFTEEDRAFFDKLREEAIANGIDVDEEGF